MYDFKGICEYCIYCKLCIFVVKDKNSFYKLLMF